jgi:hypothetical protein
MNVRILRILAIVCLASAGACSSPESIDNGSDAGNAELGFVGPKLDGHGDSLQDATAGSDGKVDPASCPFPASPASGEPGAPCKVASDCQTGFCVDSADGKICTRSCVDCCPGGMTCAQLATGSDFALVCVPQMLALCRPCETDAECASVDKNALCIDRGDNDSGNIGSYCGGGCADASDCPSGYSCKTVNGEKGAGTQCIPDSGECTCGKDAILAGATTTCKVTNDVGTCAGTRKCALSGLTLCDAPSPTVESCNGKDDNCDGQIDEAGAAGCKLYFSDGDDDGFGGGVGVCLCAPDLLHSHALGADCDDSDPAIHSGAAELCNGKDDNCNGQTDEIGAQGCKAYFADSDGDGFGAGNPSCQCAADLAFPVTSSSDCNDASVAISPAASETCNQIDDNCNGVTDEGGVSCIVFYVDDDSDGYGGTDGACLCQPDAFHTALKGGDCDDGAPNVHPKAIESCNGQDDNCDGLTDDGAASGCTLFYQDGDGDKFGGGVGACLCASDVTYTTSKGGDCDDGDKSVNPKVDEICNGKDDNCDGAIDEAGAEGCVSWFVDSDNDGFGGSALAPKCQCAAGGVYTATVAGDCLDSSKTVYPGALELCDSLDNNCDGTTDPVNSGGCQAHFLDGDSDGYGTSVSECACGSDGAFTALLSGDCDDGVSTIHPGASEIACNGADDDCDPLTPDGGSGGLTTYYKDGDGDGFGDPNTTQMSCNSVPGYVTQGGDCNDFQSGINPGVSEVGCNSIDENCNGATDEGSTTSLYYADGDGDGYGSDTGQLFCAPPGGYVSKNGDCADTDPNVYPGATELCDGLDNNCNNQIDEGLSFTKYYPDSDGDSWASSTGSVKACAAPPGFITGGGLFAVWDCNDKDASIHPIGPCLFGASTCLGAAFDETKCDGVDNDCDGKIDEGVAKTYYQDIDKDGYGNPAVSQTVCPASAPSGYVQGKNTDCNDNDVTIHPGAVDVQCDNIDQDCTKYDACGICSAATEFDFSSGAMGWTLGSGWRMTSYNLSGQALVFNDSSGGYNQTGGSSASGTFTMPDGAVYLQFSVYYNNEDDDGSGSPYYDTAAMVTINVNGNVATVGPNANIGTYTVKIPLDPAWKNTVLTPTVTVKTGNANWYTGGFAIDNIQVVCN